MPKQLAKTAGYKTLVKKIQAELSELDFFIRRRTAEGYWRIGKFIHEHLLEQKEKADYGHFLIDRLAEDVDRDASALRRSLKFYRTYPIQADQPELSWDHYKRLITVEDKTKRESFEELAVKKEWTAAELEEAIRLDRVAVEEPAQKPGARATKLTVTRARIYTYQVLAPGYIHPIEERCAIDLGFSVLINAEIGLRVKEGDLIESVKIEEKEFVNANPRESNANSREVSRYKFKRSDAKPKELYAYKALVERVVDGDTIWLNIDLGFDCWIRQKVRLRDIDAPEVSTKQGLAAKIYVESKLKKVPLVVVKTYKSDKYDRYLTDVFYLSDESNAQTVLEEGTFLNQELLDLGLATIMVD